MTDDIVERLRRHCDYLPPHQWTFDAMREAAYEIERLRAALDDECAAHRVCVEMRDAAYAEIERLRAELANREEQVARLKRERMWHD